MQRISYTLKLEETAKKSYKQYLNFERTGLFNYLVNHLCYARHVLFYVLLLYRTF